MVKHGLMLTDELVRRAIIGDGTAFTELWDTNIDSLRQYLSSTIKNLDDFYLDDICSRSFEKAFRQIRTYDPSKSLFTTWLKIIARNTALDILEVEGRTQRNRVSIDESMGVIDSIMTAAVSPLEQIVNEEDEQNLERYVNALPELYSTIARRRLIDGLSYKEITEEMGINLNTVRTRIRRAKDLIDAMKEDED